MKKLAIVFVLAIASAAVAATVNGGTLNVSRASVTINADNSATIVLAYVNAATQKVHTRALIVDSSCTRVVDQFGTVVAATAPASLCNAINTFATQLDTLIANGAAGGKLDL